MIIMVNIHLNMTNIIKIDIDMYSLVLHLHLFALHAFTLDKCI